ncbi:MAG: addiction module toxin RelE [Nanoarchaeota archaeon]|nr:addiction module toxin RelE [Nanoarchaeota archaeon]
MYLYKIQPNLQKILLKLFKKDKKTRERVIKKIREIINSDDVEHYKNLKHDLKDFKRVQIREKVLVFKFDKSNKTIIFEDFDHHDNIYKKKFG